MYLLVSHLVNQQTHTSSSHTHFASQVRGGMVLSPERKGKWENNNRKEAEIMFLWVSREAVMSQGKVKMYFHSENDMINLFDNPGSPINSSTFLLEVPCNNK